MLDFVPAVAVARIEYASLLASCGLAVRVHAPEAFEVVVNDALGAASQALVKVAARQNSTVTVVLLAGAMVPVNGPGRGNPFWFSVGDVMVIVGLN
jgi:hypothetical protein